jgi:hypothetical protein
MATDAASPGTATWSITLAAGDVAGRALGCARPALAASTNACRMVHLLRYQSSKLVLLARPVSRAERRDGRGARGRP